MRSINSTHRLPNPVSSFQYALPAPMGVLAHSGQSLTLPLPAVATFSDGTMQVDPVCHVHHHAATTLVSVVCLYQAHFPRLWDNNSFPSNTFIQGQGEFGVNSNDNTQTLDQMQWTALEGRNHPRSFPLPGSSSVRPFLHPRV